jgi:tetratricopeptide (TPR) repeat protein
LVGETGREQSLRGLSLAQSGKWEEAVPRLVRATELDLGNAQNHYNLACALIRTGDRDAARRSLEKSLELQPRYKAAQHFKDHFEGEAPPLELGEPHTIGWIVDAGPSWTKIGWAIAAFAGVMIVVSRFLHPIGVINLTGQGMTMELNRDPASMVVAFLTIVSIVGSFLWVTTDLIDRRGRAIWIVPMLVSTFCIFSGLTAVAHALYMAIGRK